jgi:hypothetical protein
MKLSIRKIVTEASGQRGISATMKVHMELMINESPMIFGMG